MSMMGKGKSLCFLAIELYLMSRLPPTLSYLTIYNPRLQPTGAVDPDDEDAEEQAHILFYTSNERAVSRDRMLRQVGLAKALVNFSELFNPDESCDNVHSQSRRMIMLSPETDFWIHAGIEVAKTPRAPPEPRAKSKGKEKELSEPTAPVLYDYHDGSVHDVAMRAHIQRGYEHFKLKHGTFANILLTLGQQALELQLERFFTVWAWSWSLEDRPEFSLHVGTPLHPSYRALVPCLDAESSTAIILLMPPYVVPSTRYSATKLPAALAEHLLTLIPPQPRLRRKSSGNSTIRAKSTPPPPRRHAPSSSYPGTPGHMGGTVSFLAMPSMNPAKWGWPGYLSFGGAKPQLKKPTAGSSLVPPEAKADPESVKESPPAEAALEETSVDAKATTAEDGALAEDKDSADSAAPEEQSASEPELAETPIPSEPEAAPPPVYHFTKTNVYLPDDASSPTCVRRKVYYITKDHYALAFVGLDDDDAKSDKELDGIAGHAITFMRTLEQTIEADERTCVVDAPSANKILQTQDTNLVSQEPFTASTTGFKSTSEHLYNAQSLHARDPTILEVFSRGQNPQHWHVSRHGLGVSNAGVAVDGHVYLEVERKEASLTDVDNVLAGVVRRFVA